MTEKKTHYCRKCSRTIDESNFYGSNNLEKYPTGKLDICKKCLTMHIDIFDPETFLWILQEIDIPYVPKKWNERIVAERTKGKEPTGMTVLGKYISAMKLKQWKDYRYKHTDILQERDNEEIRQAMQNQGYDIIEIEDAIKRNTFEMPSEVREPNYEDFSASSNAYDQASATDDFDDDLTEEDKLYLRLKWGKAYRPEEWIKLEQLYNEMMESYDIQTAGHIDTLKLICKTSLKANQLIDLNDIEGYQKMSKVYDNLMKSGKFTAAQNKAEQGEFVDSVGELVALCEREGFIPRYYAEGPQDSIDKVIMDMQKYTYNLVTEEMGLGNLIENALKKIEKEREEKLDDDILDSDNAEEDEIFDYEPIELNDEDYLEFNSFEETQSGIDEEFFRSLEEE